MADIREKYADLIRTLVPVCELPAAAQTEVINKAELVKVRKGGVLFRQGDRDAFSYYVLDGDIELHANDQLHNVISGGSDRARYAMAQLQPRQLSAKARSTSVVLKLVRDNLDKLMVLHQTDDSDDDTTNYDLATAEVQVDELDADDDVDWMTRMLQSELFSRIPTANIQSLFAQLEMIPHKAGDVIIEQGDIGEEYYIIQEGLCQVSRRPPSGGKDIPLAKLRPGDGFGEEALIANTTRNATVSMLTDGIVMRLSKDKFIDLIKKPSLTSVSFDEAREQVAEGAVWIDVRFKNEYQQGAIENSKNIPLNMLRMQAEKLDPEKHYIVYCDTGGRSSTGAFLLMERGFSVSFLDGGLLNNPQAVTATAAPESTTEPAGAKPGAQQAAVAEPGPGTGATEDPVESISKEQIDPEIKATVLETELARTNMQLEAASKKEATATMTDAAAFKKQVEEKLRQEHAKIEAAKKAAEEEARKLRAVEEARMKKLREDAERRLQEEKKQLEAVYSRNVEEMERLQTLKQEAEQQIGKQRNDLEKQAEEAKQRLDEAQKLKKEVEAARRVLEKEAQKRKAEQENIERGIQRKAQEKLALERRKMAEELARQNDELEKARRAQVAAAAARQAAKAEAEKIIAEFKASHEKAKAIEQQRLAEERKKLEEEQRKLQETLKEIQAAKAEAEAAKRRAQEEVEQLRDRAERQDVAQDDTQKKLQVAIQAAEDKVVQADEEIATAAKAEQKTETAKIVTDEDLARKREQEEKLARQLAADLEIFEEDLAKEQEKYGGRTTQQQHMQRIKERAEAAKRETENANRNLLDDIADQLGDG